MALAYGTIQELSHQLRFLLFEIGIGLPQANIDYFITLAHRDSLKRLQRAAISEGLINAPVASHHPVDFLEQLRLSLKKRMPESQFFRWDNYRAELHESIANEAMALAYRQRWNSQIKAEAEHYGSMWSWMLHEQSAMDSFLLLDQWGCTGHPHSPAFRAKPGLNRREVLQNSPEFQARTSVHWSAIHKSRIKPSQSTLDFEYLLKNEFPIEYLRWQEKISLYRQNHKDYLPVPVHPLQWRNNLQKSCASLLDNKTLILLPHHQVLAPSLVPEVMMSEHNQKCTIKLPHFSQKAINDNERAASQRVNLLLAKEHDYQNTLLVMQEFAGIEMRNGINLQPLSVQLLQNPINKLDNHQKAVPLTALFTSSPLTQTPLLVEIIKASSLNPLQYFAFYCKQILAAPLHLLVKHGAALKAGQEHIIILFTEHMPQGQIIRNQEYCTDHIDDAKEHFINSMIKNNVSFWVNIISEQFLLPVTQLWNCVREVLGRLFYELDKDTNVDPSICQKMKHALFEEVWQRECLFTMQLFAHANKSIYTKQANPLMMT